MRFDSTISKAKRIEMYLGISASCNLMHINRLDKGILWALVKAQVSKEQTNEQTKQRNNGWDALNVARKTE